VGDRRVSALTPLQIWFERLNMLLDTARAQLDDDTYAVLVDLAFRRIAREAVSVGLDEWRQAA
jgi:hypothetical protein